MPLSSKKIRIATIKKNQRGECKNEVWRWGELVEKLRNPKVDKSLSYEEYVNAKTVRQGKAKDVGSFVGGWFKSNRRRIHDLEGRSLISLDVDSGTPDDFDYLFSGDSWLSEYEYVAYTTRKHCEEKPRWRILIPLESPVSSMQYEAVARIVASWTFEDEDQSMDAIDEVSFRPAQIMYWPSVCYDADYGYEHNKGKLLRADDVFEEFGLWEGPEDWDQLPKSDKYTNARFGPDVSIQDPRTKRGIVGAFCRVYSIEQAIQEFIPDIYEATDSNSEFPRYTYLLGTGGDGAVVYDDGLILFSNHGTDPAGKHGQNAFDLVRIHKFGDLDEDEDEGTRTVDLPSYEAMEEWALEQDGVEEELEKDHVTADDFEDLDESDDEDDDEPVSRPKKKKARSKIDELFNDLDDESGAEEDEKEDAGDDKTIESLEDLAESPFDITFMEPPAVIAPEFPMDILPEFWQERIEVMSAGGALPIPYIVGSLMTTVGALIGGSRTVSIPERNWKETTNMWGVVYGSPSVAKSPAMKPFVAIMRRLNQYFDDLNEQHQQEHQAAMLKAKVSRKQTEKAFESGDGPDDFSELVDPTHCKYRTMTIGDVTAEKLVNLLSDNPQGLFLFYDELGSWLFNMKRYNNGDDTPLYLGSYVGSPYDVSRVTLGRSSRTDRTITSILGSIQPEKLNEFIKQRPDDGLLGRLTFFAAKRPESLWGDKDDTDRELIDGEYDKKTYEKLEQLFLKVTFQTDGQPEYLTLSKKAKERMFEYANHIYKTETKQTKFRRSKADEAVENVLGKGRGLILRLAAILMHLEWIVHAEFEGVARKPHTKARVDDIDELFYGVPEEEDFHTPSKIQLKHIEGAIRMREEYVKPIQEMILAPLKFDNDSSDVAKLIRFLAENKVVSFNVRNLDKSTFCVDYSDKEVPLKIDIARIRNKDVYMPLLETLENLGVIAKLKLGPDGKESRSGRKGRYFVHPKLSKQFNVE